MRNKREWTVFSPQGVEYWRTRKRLCWRGASRRIHHEDRHPSFIGVDFYTFMGHPDAAYELQTKGGGNWQ